MNQERQGWVVFLPTLAVWVLSMVGAVSSTNHSTPSAGQPAEVAPRKSRDAPKEDAYLTGRFWEDPLAVVEAETYKTRAEVRTVDDATIGRNSPPDAKLVVVLVKGQPYEDDREWRRRMRYALTCAFWSSEWAPVDGGRIRFRDVTFDQLWPGPATGEEARSKFWASDANASPSEPWALRVPYDTFRSTRQFGGRPATVQVLWVNNDLLDNRPLMRLGRLLQSWQKHCGKASVIGPPGTDRLIAMVKEGLAYGDCQETWDRKLQIPLQMDLQIWSPWATGDLEGHDQEDIAKFAKDNDPTHWSMQTWEGDHANVSADVVRTTPTDDQAVATLLGELRQRHAYPGAPDFSYGGPMRTALVAEWDSNFGRAFVRSAQKALNPSGSGTAAPPYMSIIYYARGIDGQPPSQAQRPTELAVTEARKRKGGDDPTEALLSTLDPQAQPNPNGSSAADYLVRTGVHMVAESRTRWLDREGPLRSVGLVSTDLNDRLLILKALRPKFPEALFFTTELEASYLLPEHNDVCRNLIVASAWPLSDDKDQQHNEHRLHLLPPMRESGQRALIYAVSALLYNPLSPMPPDVPPFKIYEVGLRDFHSLDVPERPPVPGRCPILPGFARWIVYGGAGLVALAWILSRQFGVASPRSAGLWRLAPFLGFFGLAALLGGFGWKEAAWVGPLLVLLSFVLLLPRLPDSLSRPPLWQVVVLVLAIVIACGINRAAGDVGGEPWALADGVSLWPAVGLRLLAAGLTVWFIVWGRRELSANLEEIRVRYFLDPRPGGAVEREFPTADELPFAKDHPDWPRRKLAKHEEAQWSGYTERCDPARSGYKVRWFIATVAALLLAAMLMITFGLPAANTRGETAKNWDTLSLGISIVCFLTLAVFVVDQNFRCRRFLAKIWGHGLTAYGFELEEAVGLIAARSASVGQLVLYPFSIAFVLGCAHTEYIESWRGLGGLYATLIVSLAVVFLSTWRMENKAKSLRARTIDYLQQRLAEFAWMKRLLSQRLDFEEIALHYALQANLREPDDGHEPAGAEDRAGKLLESHSLAAAFENWWFRTIQRLAAHTVPPEPLRILSALDGWKEKADKPEDPSKYLEALDSHVEAARKLDVAFYEARINRLNQLIPAISGMREGAFGSIWERPLLRALLIPGAGFGSISLVQSLLGH